MLLASANLLHRSLGRGGASGSIASGATVAARPSASAVPPIATRTSRAWPPSVKCHKRL